MTTPQAPPNPPIPPNTFDFVSELYNQIEKATTDGEFDPKAFQSNSVYNMISRARALVAALPDIEKTPAQLESEIEALEERIAKQRAMLIEAANSVAVRKAVEQNGGDQMDVDR